MVTVSFGNTQVFLIFPNAAMFAVIPPNASGKTTCPAILFADNAVDSDPLFFSHGAGSGAFEKVMKQ